MSEQVVTSTGGNKIISQGIKILGSNRRALWPLLALLTVLIIDWLLSPEFFNVRIVNGRFFGSVIDILKNCSPVMLLATGMTLVIATKGIDLSVGSIIAISGAVAAEVITTTEYGPFAAILLGIGAGMLCGLWNGILVAFFDIQPIIATLILYIAGRGVAQMITQGQITVFNNETLHYVGTGTFLGFPFPFILALIVLILVYFLVRRTAIGLLIEAVGANDRASYYTGINASLIKLFAYILSGACAGIAGLILMADIKGADANNVGANLELDAILAVVIGGTSLNGGRFYLGLSAVGALIIQSLQTGVLLSDIQTEFNQIIKAVVILAVLLLQSDQFRQFIMKPFRRSA